MIGAPTIPSFLNQPFLFHGQPCLTCLFPTWGSKRALSFLAASLAISFPPQSHSWSPSRILCLWGALFLLPLYWRTKHEPRIFKQAARTRHQTGVSADLEQTQSGPFLPCTGPGKMGGQGWGLTSWDFVQLRLIFSFPICLLSPLFQLGL